MDILNAIGDGTWSVGGYIVPFLAVLTLVVFVHEMGHFLVGRWCGVGVEAFSVGFGPEILGFTDRNGTRWKLSAIPLGGYVKFVGDANAASVPDTDALHHMSAAERAVSLPHKSVAQRAAVVAAGPIANFILAIAIFAGMFSINGRNVIAARVETVQVGTAAERAGFRPDDVVVSINGRAIESFADMQRIVSGSAGDTLTVVVDRNGENVTLTAVPDYREQASPFGKQRIGLLGLQASTSPDAVKHLTYGPLQAVRLGALESWYVVERTFSYLGRVIVGRESADQLSGPLRIAEVSGKVASIGGLSGLISLAAVLSVSIGLLNLFPIPLLDGGHLLFYGIEALRGRPLSERAQEIGFRIGLGFVVMLMLFSTWNDIVHLTSTYLTPGT